MTWTRHVRTDLAHSLLMGRTTGDPKGWYPQQKYPEPGTKLERVARKALARALRRGDEQFIKLVSSMIHPGTKSSIIERKIEFTWSEDRRFEPKISGRRDLEIATFIHEWRAKHPGQSIPSAIAEAADHFGFADRTIWDVWKEYKPTSRSNRHCK
jgi:hypothetical protein